MTRHELIFSNSPRHRITRHVVFWIVWCVAFLLLFHYPVHSFRGWSLTPSQGASIPNIQKMGLPLFIVKTLMINVFLSVVIPQIAFVYFLLYWLLPNYFYARKKAYVTVVIIVGVLTMYVFTASAFKYLTPLFNYVLGSSPTFLKLKLGTTILFSMRDQVITLPIVAGFGVMIKLVKRWWFKQNETEQLVKENSRAELQLLKAQIHPHFLFNTLNNIYFFTLSNAKQAPLMIRKLSGILQYILNECNQPLVPLVKEVQMIIDYMELEKIRYGEQMKMTIDIQENCTEEGNAASGFIAPLLLIPFVENSFKHGTSKMIAHPWVNLSIKVDDKLLHFSIVNSRPQSGEGSRVKGNIGLKNVTKRLELLYPAAHELNIEEKPESFGAHLKIVIEESADGLQSEQIKTTASYELA